ncbi:MAG: MmgE/PrpD family protein [Betaproteobacteria bacterium]|nr:MmgE/PrpD family protein [Betaproteobacteria bacterium]
MNGTKRSSDAARKEGAVANRGEGATRKLVYHAATLNYEALPSALVALTKQCILDTLGVCIGATGLAEEAPIVTEYVKDMGGKPESTILGFGGKAPAPWATFVNGSFGHMLDYDDVGDNNHISIATIPLAFAVAEMLGGVSGRHLITAIAGGSDVHTRINEAIDIPEWIMTEGWFATQLIGFMSGAATAGRLLGLSPESMDNAFGIGFNQSCGSRQMAVGAATHMRSMQAGFSGQGAVVAAQLAQRGIIGSKEVLEGRYGLFKTYVRTNSPDWEALLGGLGQQFPILDNHGFKVWPACAYTRHANAATLKLRKDHNLRPEDVESITVIGGPTHTQFLSEPLELKRRPQTGIDGKYSIPFTVAVMMAHGNVTLRDYTDAGLHDPTILAMADRVRYRPASNAQIAACPPGSKPKTWIEIRTKDGSVLEAQADGVPGDPQNPVDRNVLETKFRDCISFSAKPVPAHNIDRAIEMIFDLENVADATEIIRLLS